MSLKRFSNILYKELPSKNLAFVEGGVLIYPEMIGLTMPLKMDDNDMYRYLTLYSSVMDKLGSAKDGSEGKQLLKDVAEELQVDFDKFKIDNINIIMLESLLANKILTMDFKNIQKTYQKQKGRAELILADLKFDVPEDVKKTAKSLPKSFTRESDSVTVSMGEEESLSIEPPYTMATPPPSSLPVQTNLTSSEQTGSPTHTGLVAKTKDLVTKPPVAIALIALGLWGMTLIPKKKKRGYRS